MSRTSRVKGMLVSLSVLSVSGLCSALAMDCNQRASPENYIAFPTVFGCSPVITPSTPGCSLFRSGSEFQCNYSVILGDGEMVPSPSDLTNEEYLRYFITWRRVSIQRYIDFDLSGELNSGNRITAIELSFLNSPVNRISLPDLQLLRLNSYGQTFTSDLEAQIHSILVDNQYLTQMDSQIRTVTLQPIVAQSGPRFRIKVEFTSFHDFNWFFLSEVRFCTEPQPHRMFNVTFQTPSTIKPSTDNLKGGSKEFVCTVSSQGLYAWQWEKNNSVIDKEDSNYDITIRDGTRTTKLVISDLDFSDTGQYKCTATTMDVSQRLFTGSLTQEILDILAPPSILALDSPLAPGGSTSFLCRAQGNPLPEIVWLHNGRNSTTYSSKYTIVQTVNSESYIVESVLKILDVRSNDRGNVTCVAKGSINGLLLIENKTSSLVICNNLTSPDNGQVVLNGIAAGSRANYSCDVGFIPATEPVLQCQANGDWSEIPRCNIDCGPLLDPANGSVSLVRITATYTCNFGYVLASDDDTRHCLIDGEWSGSQPECIILDCGTLHDPVNGRVSQALLNATYTCDFGYILVGINTRSCLTGGQWSGSQPTCAPDAVIGSVVSVSVILLVSAIVCCIFCYKKRHTKQRSEKVETIKMEGSSLQPTGTRDTYWSRTLSDVLVQLPEAIKIPASQIKLASVPIGQGVTGIVYKGQLMNWNSVPEQEIAVKTLKGLFTSSDIKQLAREIIKMKDFHHPSVMSLIGVCLDAGAGVSMVMPYMANGSLLDFVRKERGNIFLDASLSQNQIQSARKLLLKMCHRIALGMEYLAGKKFVHRDLAARNCLLDQQGNIKVGDFGLAEDVYATGYFRQQKNSDTMLPYKWMAIESLNSTIFTEKSDVWSYGVTVWEVFSAGKTPYSVVDPQSLIELLEKGQRLKMPSNAACSNEIYAVIQKCWLSNPDDRPTFSELVSMMVELLTAVSDTVMELQLAVNMQSTEQKDSGEYEDFFSLVSRLRTQDGYDDFLSLASRLVCEQVKPTTTDIRDASSSI